MVTGSASADTEKNIDSIDKDRVEHIVKYLRIIFILAMKTNAILKYDWQWHKSRDKNYTFNGTI